MTMHRIERFFRCTLALTLLAAPCLGFAQSCASAIPITTNNFTGTTCGGTNSLPTLANGAILSIAPQVIYAQPDLSATYGYEIVSLNADPNTLSLYVCKNPCSTYSTCVAVGDVGASGSVSLTVSPPSEYSIIVGSSSGASGTCSSYTLAISVPLN
jgi:hypothetical protein